VNAPPDYNSDQLFQSNLTFCVVCDFNNLQFEKSIVFKTSGLFTIDSFNANFDAKFKKHSLFVITIKPIYIGRYF
jgi:hypothetical protein